MSRGTRSARYRVRSWRYSPAPAIRKSSRAPCIACCGRNYSRSAPSAPIRKTTRKRSNKARQERDRGYEPPLEGRVRGFASFETVYLGFPIWGETTPPVIRSFLKAHDWSGKTLQPFITHGGYGPGNSMAILRSHAPGARIEEPFVLEADQERRTLNQVKEWLGK
nr:flavodoxin [Novosphingobium sp. AP12]